jgi:hypothetical protein
MSAIPEHDPILAVIRRMVTGNEPREHAAAAPQAVPDATSASPSTLSSQCADFEARLLYVTTAKRPALTPSAATACPKLPQR